VYHPPDLHSLAPASRARDRLRLARDRRQRGIALGPFAAATLLFLVDQWQLVAAILAVPGFIAAAAGSRPTSIRPPQKARRTPRQTTPCRWANSLTNSRVLFTSAFAVVFAIIAVEGLYYRGMLTYLPEILHGLPAIGDITLSTNLEGISPGDYIYVSLLVVGMAGQYVGGKLTDRIRSERGLIAIFAVLCVLALAFVPIMSMGSAHRPYCIVLGFFLFATQPLYQDAVAVHTPARARPLVRLHIRR